MRVINWCPNRFGAFRRPRLFTIYKKNPENFGCNVNGKTNLVFPNGKFLGKIGFLERETKISKRNFRTETVHSICYFWPVPGLSDWIPWNCKWNSKSRMEIPIRVLTLSIYHTCRPTGFSDQMINNQYHTNAQLLVNKMQSSFFYYDTLPRYHGRPANKTPLN